MNDILKDAITLLMAMVVAVSILFMVEEKAAII